MEEFLLQHGKVISDLEIKLPIPIRCFKLTIQEWIPRSYLTAEVSLLKTRVILVCIAL